MSLPIQFSISSICVALHTLDLSPKTKRLRLLCVVGDTDQNIYSWRGAEIKNMLRFEKTYPEVQTFFLEENYRSTGNIINAASAVVRNNKFRTPKQLWTKEVAGEPITLYEAWGENDEAAWIAQKIADARSQSH